VGTERGAKASSASHVTCDRWMINLKRKESTV
jgi:hypothetical protein